jgi:hypothetical protein
MIKRAQESFRATSAGRPVMGATLVTSLGYVTQPSRPRGRHRKQPPPRRLLWGRRLALGGSAVLLAALVVSVGAVVKWATHQPVSLPTARPSAPVAPNPSASPSPSPSQSAGEPVRPTVAAPAGPFAVDDRGFVNSDARCDGTQTAVAIGRTPGSLVVICGDRSGQYGYRGVRLSDDAVLKTAARTTPKHQFIAQNARVTYSISPAELLVTAGGAVIKKEPMIDYRGPRL